MVKSPLGGQMGQQQQYQTPTEYQLPTNNHNSHRHHQQIVSSTTSSTTTNKNINAKWAQTQQTINVRISTIHHRVGQHRHGKRGRSTARETIPSTTVTTPAPLYHGSNGTTVGGTLGPNVKCQSNRQSSTTTDRSTIVIGNNNTNNVARTTINQ